MLQERLIQLAQELSAEKAQMITDLNNESKVALTVFLGGANILLAWIVSRQMEGTVNNRLEKGLIVAGSVGITAANAIFNHQIWT